MTPALCPTSWRTLNCKSHQIISCHWYAIGMSAFCIRRYHPSPPNACRRPDRQDLKSTPALFRVQRRAGNLCWARFNIDYGRRPG